MDLEKQYSHTSMVGVRTVKEIFWTAFGTSIKSIPLLWMGFDTEIEDSLFPIFSKKI